MRRLCVPAIGIAAMIPLQTACSILPGSGPSVASLQDKPDLRIVDVAPGDAQAMAQAAADREQDALRQALAALKTTAAPPRFRFQPGVELSATLWTISPWLGSAAGSEVSASVPGSVSLGTYTVAADDTIVLPYVGSVRLTGLTLAQAQDVITQRYDALGIVQRPAVVVSLHSVPQGQIIVTGAIGQPKMIAWTPAGLTLAEALTAALGDGASSLSQDNGATSSKSAIRVEVLREGQPGVELPMRVALEETIRLRPGDRIVVRKNPAIRVTVLGGGIRKVGLYGFENAASLAEVLATASGLDSNVANDHAVFVFRRAAGQPPTLYDFAWNRVQGFVAAQTFPMADSDVVYVAEAPIVPVE